MLYRVRDPVQVSASTCLNPLFLQQWIFKKMVWFHQQRLNFAYIHWNTIKFHKPIKKKRFIIFINSTGGRARTDLNSFFWCDKYCSILQLKFHKMNENIRIFQLHICKNGIGLFLIA